MGCCTVQLDVKTRNLLFNAALPKGQGGWQDLIRELQEQAERNKGVLSLTAAQLDRISRYAQGTGGYQTILQAVLDCPRSC